MVFKEKVIAFIDIIGFKDLVKKSDKGEGKSLNEILEILDIFKVRSNTVCPNSKPKSDDLDFVITQITDCTIISAELSDAGIVNLIEHCRNITSKFMHSGIMCRGFITIGNIYHAKNQVIGTGYQEAYAGEPEVVAFGEVAENGEKEKTPFLEVGSKVVDYLKGMNNSSAERVIKTSIHSDGHYHAINPFSCLTCFADLSDKEQLINVKNTIGTFKDKIRVLSPDENQKALVKSKYYYKFLDEQAQKCDERISREEILSQPFPSGKL